MMSEVYTQADMNKKDIDKNREDICELQEEKVDKKDFNPVKSIVYGLVGLILTSVAVAIVNSVINNGL